MNMHEIIAFLRKIQQLLSGDSKLEEGETEHLAYLQILQQLSIEQRSYFVDVLKKMDVLGKLPGILGNLENTELEKKPSDITLKSGKGLLALAQLALAFECKGSAEEFAKKLEVMCENLESSLEYLTAYREKNPESATVFSDACSFSLPETGSIWTKESWRKRAKKDGWKNLVENEEFKKVLSAADIIEAHLIAAVKEIKKQPRGDAIDFSDIGAPWEINKIKPALSDKTQTQLTNLWKKYFFSSNQNDFLLKCPLPVLHDVYNRVARQYRGIPYGVNNVRVMLKLTSMGMLEHYAKEYFTLTPRDSEAIPTVFIQSSAILDNTSYYLKKLDSKDLQAAFLGKLTDCCLSIDHGIGRQFVIHGINEPDSGFYVVCKQKGENPGPTDQIVSQAWAWRKNEALILDSIESLKLNLSGKIKHTDFTNEDLWNAMYQKLAVTLVGQQGISIVMVGWGGYGQTSSNIGVTATNSYNIPPSSYTLFDHSNLAVRHSDSADKMILAIDKIPLSELHRLRDRGKHFIGKEDEKKYAQEKIMAFINSENAIANLCVLKKYCEPSEIVNIVNDFRSFYKSHLNNSAAVTEFKSTSDDNLWLTLMTQPTPLKTINWTDWLLEYLRVSNPISETVVEAFKNIDTNAKNKFGETIGMLAIRNGTPALINNFIRAGLFDNENKALMYAIQLGKIEIVECWLTKPINCLYMDDNHDTVLTLAIKNSRFDIAKKFIDQPNFRFRDILLQASQHNQIETMKWLVEQSGIDLNERNSSKAKRNSATLLIHAVTKNKLDLIKFLVQQPNINLNQTNYDNNTALELAIYMDSLDIINCLLDQPTIELKHDILIRAVNNQQWDIVRCLANHPKIDLNTKQSYVGKNALELTELQPNAPKDVLALLDPKQRDMSQAKENPLPSISDEKEVEISDENITELQRKFFFEMQEQRKNRTVEPTDPTNFEPK